MKVVLCKISQFMTVGHNNALLQRIFNRLFHGNTTTA